MKFIRYVLAVTGLICAQVYAQDSLLIRAERATEVIEIDGKLSEQIWKRPGVTDFKMKRPVEGNAPTQRTEAWIAYDDAAIYVAARMYDSAPDSIMRVLGRRDYDVTADWFGFYVDPYHDKRTGYYFSVSAVGSLQDGTLYNDEWNDNSWDGVWEAKTNIDAEGWTVEIRIPYSQLRFIEQPTYVWGVNFHRSIGRNNERDMVVYTPNKGSGFVSRFPQLVGIENITPPRQMELLPYFVSKGEFLQHAPNDPFNNGSRFSPDFGADLKIALSTNLTLNATINPDFGQVEVDPAVVNLSDVESSFQEKRPFFVEGSNIFEFGYGGANNNWGFNFGNPSFFYSRRIGRAPQGDIPVSSAGPMFLDYPQGTHILGAGKITGKIADGWNFGTIHAVTNREFAQVETSSVRVHDIEVEPLTYYGIARLQRDFNDGRQGLGFIATYTRRLFSDPRLENEINKSAMVGGIDGWTFLDEDKVYVVTGWGAFTNVQGNAARMLDVQQSSRHYYQRPDASYLSLDPNATSLSGWGSRFALNKQKGQWILNSALGVLNPGLDVNDMGFQWRNDVINYHVVTGYKWTDPTEYYNSFRFQTALFESRDFGNRVTWHGWWSNFNVEFKNFWGASAGTTYNPKSMDTRSTRGGPAMENPLGREFWTDIWTNSKEQFVAEVFAYTYKGGGGEQYSSDLYLTFKPAPNVNLSVGPSYSKNLFEAQWVESYVDPTATATYGTRYVFANIDQTQLSANIRLNWTFTPQLSLQTYIQPLISVGKYTNLKTLSKPSTFQFMNFGTDGSTIVTDVDPDGNKSYTVDADGAGPSVPQTISNPDFNFISLRGNAVLRWEYRPGSAIYFVWTQSRARSDADAEFQLKPSFDHMFQVKPDNIFMVKFTYWFNM